MNQSSPDKRVAKAGLDALPAMVRVRGHAVVTFNDIADALAKERLVRHSSARLRIVSQQSLPPFKTGLLSAIRSRSSHLALAEARDLRRNPPRPVPTSIGDVAAGKNPEKSEPPAACIMQATPLEGIEP